MALQFALNRLFIVTANMGTLFENVRPGRGDERGSGEPVALCLKTSGAVLGCCLVVDEVMG